MPANRLLKRDWQKDHVYLVQFPRAGCIVTPSPFALKMETWLRVTDVPYSNISNNFNIKSSKGQIPFIELNGRQIADTSFIIEHLKKEFHKDLDAHLTTSERASATAYTALLENNLFWCLAYNRSRHNWFATEDGMIKHFSGLKKTAFQKFFSKQIQKKITGAVFAQGTGRHSPTEVDEIIKENLNALSVLLGNKDFFFGTKPTTFDCTAFGQLAQLYYTPLISDVSKKHLKEACPNLEAFIFRMKDRYWPDWDELLKTLSLENTKKE